MATRDHNRIDLDVKGYHREGYAAGVISPGHLIKRDANGEYIVNNNAAGTACQPIFAKHDKLQGKTLDDDYADGDKVFFVQCMKGDVVAARIAAGQDIANGGALQASNDGTLMAHAAGEIVAYAREAVDNNPGVGGADAFIAVEVA